MKTLKKLLLLTIVLQVASCSMVRDEDGSDPTDPENQTEAEIPSNLHFAFKTEDWERQIDCTHLDLDATSSELLMATSQSTGSKFYFVVPASSSEMAKAANLGKYPIGIEEYFSMALILPMSQGSETRLKSEIGSSESDSFNEVVSITLDSSEGAFDFYSVKGRYKMKMEGIEDEALNKTCSGTYHFKIRTARN
ncbi:hypothetical protein FKX85_06890 [Echinicola soli]|uniref:Lipoprotein n=1 Tax=Echinicola soli TaxID=2591634 RepID=A0A514CGJ5_9BACT|nr:hypothetical protein [Echinicola soli]QDH78774.1 hypothetical protein FKX85_06890 [Echinicola soli]